ncbi:hypothetical protein HID58_088363 [Brassica napus]|uniref:Pentatricopeptide repeat-containing protein n=1 Tax=Brassica napus TaxID=3708 RepID=A0ABQ7XVZ3_BRANA|nr:hypothetical protein HID58_088363 [Brassica napus]
MLLSPANHLFDEAPSHDSITLNLSFSSNLSSAIDSESQFVDAVKRIVRGKRSWEIALSRDLVARRLKPTHVEEILIETLDEPKLSLRFFNFLGLHRGFDHSTASFCILIHALHYVRIRRALDGVLVFRMMTKAGLLPEVRTLSALLHGLVHCRHYGLAMEVFEEMTNAGVRPDVYIYSGVLEPTVVTYTSLMGGYCSKGKTHNALRLYHEMTGKGIAPSLYTFTTLISGLFRGGLIPDAVKLFNEMEEWNIKPNRVTYNVMIEGYCEEGDIAKAFEAFGIWDLMINEGCVPNEVTYTTVINGLCKAGFVNEAEILRSKMLIPNQVTYGCFLDILTKGEGDMKRALELHDAILKGLLANTATYNMLIRGFCRQGRMDEASELLTKMTGDGVSPDCITYTTMIYEFCRKSDVKKAIELWNSMMERGVRPDRVAYNTMIHGCCVLGEMEKAIELRSEMLRQGLKPNSKTSGTSILNDSSSKS